MCIAGTTICWTIKRDENSWLESTAQAMTGDLAEVGLNLPQDRLAIVEVPARLRMVGGGWRMGSLAALPGIVLVGERGLAHSEF